MNSSSDDTDRGSRFLLVPAVTFLVGLVLGAVLVWVGTDLRGGEPQPGGTAAPTVPTPTGSRSSSDVTVTVPADCLAAAQAAEDVLGLGRQAASAVADLDAKRLQDLIDEMEKLEPRVRQAADNCQSIASNS